MMTLLGKFAGVLVLLFALLLLCCPPEYRPIFKETLSDYKVHLGLDLKGGSELLYQVDPKDVDAARNLSDVVDETIGVISQRIFESNIVKDPRIQKQGEELILIQLPGLNQEETELVKHEIETLGNLEFRLVASKGVGAEIIETDERGSYDTARTAGENRLNYYQKRMFGKGYQWYSSREASEPARLLWVRDGYDFTGKKFRKFSMTFHDARKAIGFELKEEYKGAFGDFTEKYKGEQLAILFNNKVVATPVISTKIPGSGVLVGFKAEELNDLMKVLRSGSLEIQPELLNENTIGPSLGEDAIRLGLIAGIIGLIAVVLFMLFYYMGAGIIANFALFINIFTVGGILVIWGETLTLPGIAGVVLMMGMAVDANILIFERMREEKRKRLETFQKDHSGNVEEVYTKEDLLDIINNSYSRAFTTIFDSNVTTLITAIILYVVGSSTTKGFAFTLGWGIIANFFTAIVITRIMFEIGIECGWFKKIAMLEWIKNITVPFHRGMLIACTCSAIVIVLGLGVFFNRGTANYGLDLKGGILAQLSLQKPLTSEEVRKRLSENFQIEVQHIETEEGRKVNGWFEFSIRLPNLNQEQIEQTRQEIAGLTDKMREKSGALKEFNARIIRSDDDIKRAKRVYARLRSDNAPQDEIASAKKVIEQYEQIKQDSEKSLNELGKEVDQIKEQRRVLIEKKNLLAGVEELKKVVQTKFTEELSPLPFGELKLGEGRFRNYHVLPMFMRTPVSGEFVRETLQKQSDIFKQVYVGGPEFGIWMKAKDPAMGVDEIAQVIRTKLDLASRLEASEIKVSKSENSKFDYFILAKFSTPVPESAVKAGVERCDWASFELRPLDQYQTELRKFHLFLLLPNELLVKTSAELQNMVEQKIRDTIKEAKYENKTVYLSDPFPRFTQISGLVAKEQKAKAYQAIFLSLIAILLYIAFRFPNGFVFGFGAVVALTHDVLITLGAIAVFSGLGLVHVEVDLTVIAALLTIVGYSINNTIVIFDRLRENQHKYEQEIWDRFDRKRLAYEWDLALSQTLSRTTLTSLTTLFSIVAIFVLNVGQGNSMEGFSFSMLIGIIVGTYSSILVASAIVFAFERKKRRA